MRILFATSEMTPVARVGGLAEAAAGLVKALRAQGHDVGIVMPDYGGTDLAAQHTIDLDVPEWVGPCHVRRGIHPVLGDLTLVHTAGIDRPHPYTDEHGEGWSDNDRRFMGFSATVAALNDVERPDVLHLNDWHTAAVLGLQTVATPSVLTIHTLGYQGTMDGSWLGVMGTGVEHFEWFGACNPLAGGIALADRVVAVSPNYANEILTSEAGMGLDGRLRILGDRLVGIRNGIDVEIWNPATDPHTAEPYDATDLAGKVACRAQLHDIAGWADSNHPIIGVVTRLVEQKGLDILNGTLRFLDGFPARLFVLGSGSAQLAWQLRQAADDAPDQVFFFDGYDEPLAHQIFAGADLFVMPSRFEPCGLAQMQAMAYGTIPVVTDVGGLHDTVIDADADRANGTGFISKSVDAAGVVDALHRAVRAYRHSARRGGIQRRGMGHDWSWVTPARRHLDLYEQAQAR
ncbi:MAG: glycogen synthase [Actinomycetia bacterium]|nr:glycogen synthase [Actinomycetes bacterium]